MKQNTLKNDNKSLGYDKHLRRFLIIKKNKSENGRENNKKDKRHKSVLFGIVFSAYQIPRAKDALKGQSM